MDDSIHRTKRPKAMVVAAALVLSAAALAALVHFQGTNRVQAIDVNGDSAARPLVPPAPPAPARTRAPEPAHAGEAPALPGGVSGHEVEPASREGLGGVGRLGRLGAPAPAEEAYVVVPDFSGKRLIVARRQARALGLRLVARDSTGWRIHSAYAASYRVHSQLVPAGTHVAPHGLVQVRARDLVPSYGEGY